MWKSFKVQIFQIFWIVIFFILNEVEKGDRKSLFSSRQFGGKKIQKFSLEGLKN